MAVPAGWQRAPLVVPSKGKEGGMERLAVRRRGGGSLAGVRRTRRRKNWSALPSVLVMLMGLLAPWCRVSGQADQLRVLVPLYARPNSDFWNHMVEAGHNSTVSFSVVVNPNSGPGDSTDDEYTTGMNDLANAGVEVLCYVPTGFGSTNVSEVTRDIDTYETFYPSLCGGYFFDEGPGTEENTWKYTDYYSHAQSVGGPDSTVVVNPGIRPHDSLYNIGDRYALENPDMGGQVVITSFENKFEVYYDGSQQYINQKVPFPPRHLQDRYMHSILVYAAYFSTLEEFLDWTAFQLYCANWGYIFFTDDAFGDDGNPWDALPSYFTELLEAVAKAPESAEACGTWAPTPGPTIASTFAPLAPGETRPPVPTPAPTEFSTAQPASLGGTRAPLALPPTLAPTRSPTPSPTASPTVVPTSQPISAPNTETEGSGGQRTGGSSSFYSPATLLSGAVLLATALC